MASSSLAGASSTHWESIVGASHSGLELPKGLYWRCSPAVSVRDRGSSIEPTGYMRRALPACFECSMIELHEAL